jgi:hypothetical protein
MSAASRIVLFAFAMVQVTVMGCGDIRRWGMSANGTTINQNLHHRFEVPLSVVNGNYSSTPWYTIVDVDMSETEFLRWCKDKGWSPSKVDPLSPQSFCSIEAGGQVAVHPIRQGYVFDAMDGTIGFMGVYDSEMGRASVSYSTR